MSQSTPWRWGLRGHKGIWTLVQPPRTPGECLAREQPVLGWATSSVMTAFDARAVASVCRCCTAGCGIVAEVVDGDLVTVQGDKSHPLSHGYLCPKGSSLVWSTRPRWIGWIIRGSTGTASGGATFWTISPSGSTA